MKCQAKRKQNKAINEKVARTRGCLLKNPQSGSKKAKLNARIC